MEPCFHRPLANPGFVARMSLRELEIRAVSLHLYAPPVQRMQLYDGSTGTSHPRRSGRRALKSSVSVR